MLIQGRPYLALEGLSNVKQYVSTIIPQEQVFGT